MELPDLSEYRLHKVVDDVDLDGVVVRGLRGAFHRRPVGAAEPGRGAGGTDAGSSAGPRVLTVGVYSYAGAELFMAWGYVGEAHCRFTAVRRADGSWGRPQPGCPPVSKVCDGGRVTALTLGEYTLPAAPMTGPPSGGARAPAPAQAVGGLSGPPPAACATDGGSLSRGAAPG